VKVTAPRADPTPWGVSGTVNLTSVGSTYAGNYNAEVNLVAGGNTTYEGSFSAPLCAQWARGEHLAVI